MSLPFLARGLTVLHGGCSWRSRPSSEEIAFLRTEGGAVGIGEELGTQLRELPTTRTPAAAHSGGWASVQNTARVRNRNTGNNGTTSTGVTNDAAAGSGGSSGDLSQILAKILGGEKSGDAEPQQR